jgi:hypothetical protein
MYQPKEPYLTNCNNNIAGFYGNKHGILEFVHSLDDRGKKIKIKKIQNVHDTNRRAESLLTNKKLEQRSLGIRLPNIRHARNSNNGHNNN